MENEQYKPIGKPASGTSQHLSRLIQDYEDKGIKVIVIGAGEPPRELLERAMMENSACVVVIEDIDLILKDKNLTDTFVNPPIVIKNYRENLNHIFVSDKKNPKPWESQRKIKKFKKRGGR